MKTLMIAMTAALLATSAQATVWPSPKAEADARAAAKAGASSESIAFGLVKSHNVTSVQTAMDLANEVTQNQAQNQGQHQEQGNRQTTVVEGNEAVRQTPDVTAIPGKTTAQCYVAVAAGGGALGAALSISGAIYDEGCGRNRDALMLVNLGEDAAAIRRLCEGEHMRQALAGRCDEVGYTDPEPQRSTVSVRDINDARDD
jgi:hypothetical protein